ncbi:response regulator [Phormidium tenue FACHB-886]|nr:response regulator [Phormidium tenue FACHB-886]
MCRILIVDDIEDNVLLLQTFLEAEGYVVETADSGWTGLRSVESLRPNIVLLDILMPDMSGYSVVQRIRQQEGLSETRVVLVTACSVLDEDEAMAMGADAFIRKPVDLDQLLATVKKYCP